MAIQRTHRTLFATAAGLFFLAVALVFANPAAAAPPATGDWLITGFESYADQTLTLANSSTEYGNITVAPTGILLLLNVTLVMPFQSTFQVNGTLVVQDSTLLGEPYNMLLSGPSGFQRTTIHNATFGGIVVDSMAVTFNRTTFECGGDNGGTIHLRQPLSFRNNTMLNGCLVGYELAPLSSDMTIDFYNNTYNDPGGGGTQLTLADALHTGYVTYDIHRLSVDGGGWSILVGAIAQNTTVNIHDSVIVNTSLASIRSDSYNGSMHLWNLTFNNVLRAARVNGLAGDNRIATIDNITVSNTGGGILAGDATWIIRNSSISGASPQFETEANGHIKIYDTADNAFSSAFPAAGGSIEHFVTLRMSTPTWQNAVPILGQRLTLLDPTGGTALEVDPATWSSREIVWWGMYDDGSTIDSRVLKPTIRDGGLSFNCTPASFFVSPGMATVDVACIDDSLPRITVTAPSFPRIQNVSLVEGTARVDEAGSGLTIAEFSLDNITYGPVSFAPGDARNFSYSRAGVPDGVYRVYFRALDRTGNVRVVSAGPLTIDTVLPTITVDPLPAIFSGSRYTIEGVTEENTTITVSRTGGFTNTTHSGVGGAFSVEVRLDEGLNGYTVTARDQAGNTFSFFATTLVDTQPPPLAVLLDGRPASTAYESDPTVRVAGSSELAAEVRVNGLLASRTGEAFSIDMPLARGLTNLTVTATDVAGNTVTWVGAAYFDDVAPTLTLTVNGQAPPAGATVWTRFASAALAVTASDDNTGVVSLLVNGKSYDLDAAGGFSMAFPLTEGENPLTVTASDAVGNTGAFHVTITRDAAAPGVTVSVEADASPVVFTSGQAFTRGATVKVVLDVTENGTATLAGASHAVVAGENAFVVSLVEGRNSFPLTLTDLAGNAAPPTTFTVERRSAPPVLTVTSPAPGASVDTRVVDVTGTADPLATVRINGQVVPVLPTGQFHATVALAPGSNLLSVDEADALGNTNSTTVTVTRTTETTTAPPPAGGIDAMAIVLLVVGLAAGAAVGLVLSRRRRASGGAEPVAQVEADPSTNPEPVEQQPRGPRLR